MAKSQEEQIFIGDNDMVVELLGEAKAEFIAMRQEMKAEQALLETEYAAKQTAKQNILKKLGLTQDELETLLGA